jgi:predicted ATPase
VFVGRRIELERLAELIDGAGLVTLLGPAGAGKSVLAVRAAAHAGRAPIRCSLEGSHDRTSVLEAMAGALESASTEDGVEKAIAALSGNVLVLDGAEKAAPELAPLAAKWAESTRILITSRQPLLRDEEQRFEIGGLPLDDGRALFLEIARVAEPTFAPNEMELGAINEIVEALDGLPLAIEIVASRFPVIPVAELLDRFARDTRLLSLEKPTAPLRHTTLEEAIARSWELLSIDEQRALALCSVFEDGFTLEAAEGLLGDGAADMMMRLKEKSLLRMRRPRFFLYRSVNLFAAKKLDEMSLREDAERRHAELFVRCASRWQGEIYGPQGVERLDQLELERANLRAARERMTDRDPALAARAGLCAAALADVRGEDSSFVGQVLALAERSGAIELVAQAHRAMAAALRVEGRLEEALGHARRAHDVITGTEWRREEAEIVRELGMCHRELRRDLEAHAHLEAALLLSRELELPSLEAMILGNLGTLARLTDRTASARELYQSALEINRRMSDVRNQGIVLGNLGHVALREGALEEARSLFMRGKTMVRRVRDRRSEGVLAAHLAHVEFLRGRLRQAKMHAEEARVLLRLTGDRAMEALFLAFECALTCAATERDEPWQRRFDEACDRLAELGPHPHGNTLEMLSLTFEVVRARRDPHQGLAMLSRVAQQLDAAADRSQASIYATIASQIVARELTRAERANGRATVVREERSALQIAADGQWLKAPAGSVVDLSRRRTLRRLLVHLAEARDRDPGAVVNARDLIQAGWPNEKLDPDSAFNRLYVAISTLRRFGLKGILEARGDGYLLRPEIPFLRVHA